MKILKNIFGSKPKQNPKYEPNTLAEMNGSPDLRLATAKEKEVDISIPKSDETRKASKSTSKASNQKTKTNAKKASTTSKTTQLTNDNNSEPEPKKTVKASLKPSSVQTTQKQKVTKKSTSETKSSTKEATMKKEASKTVETKKSVSAPAKNADGKDKPEAKKTVNKQAAKSSSATKATTKKDVKPETVAKKSSSSANKKTTEEAAKAIVKKAAPKDSTTTKVVDKNKKTTRQTKVADADVLTESKASKSGKFEIKKSKDGRFVFNLYASNNLIVATSQVYSSSTSAMNGIKSVIANAASSPIEDQTLKKITSVPFPKWEIYLDKGEEYRFRLCASNGSCVCHSQGYTSKASCKKGIESIIKFANDAEITKVYLEKNKEK